MLIQIDGIDSNGIPRTYGLSRNRDDAIRQCVQASKDYLKRRKEIPALFLYDADTQKPIYQANGEHWSVDSPLMSV